MLEIVHSTPLREEIWTFDVDFPEVSLYSYRALERTTTRSSLGGLRRGFALLFAPFVRLSADSRMSCFPKSKKLTV